MLPAKPVSKPGDQATGPMSMCMQKVQLYELIRAFLQSTCLHARERHGACCLGIRLEGRLCSSKEATTRTKNRNKTTKHEAMNYPPQSCGRVLGRGGLTPTRFCSPIPISAGCYSALVHKLALCFWRGEELCIACVADWARDCNHSSQEAILLAGQCSKHRPCKLG